MSEDDTGPAHGWPRLFDKAIEAEQVRMRAQAMTGSTRPSFTCPVCGCTSYNPNDVVHRYCGNCRAFVDDLRVALITPDGVRRDPGRALRPTWRDVLAALVWRVRRRR